MKDSIKQAKNDPSLLSTKNSAGVYTVQNGNINVSAMQSQAISGQKSTSLRADAENYWTLNNLTPQHGYEQTSDVTFDNNIFSVEFTNNWLRWLSGYVEFYGPDGSTPVVPQNWSSMVPGGLAGVYDSDTKKYVQIFSSVNTILAIPVGNTPSAMTFPWPANASSVKLMAGGIGRTGGIQGQDGHYYGGWDSQACTPGAIMTGIFNFGIPTACLLMGAAVANSSLTRIAQDIFSTVLDIAVAIVNGPVSSAIQGGNTTTLMTAFADLIPRLLLDCAELAVWMDAEIAEAAVEEATPIFGWIAMAVSVITDIAQLAETSAEVASSPATFEFMASRTIDAQWTLTPDVNHQNTWPLEATHYEVVATYSDGTSRSTSGRMQSSPQTGPITVYFNKDQNNRLPAGGTVMFSARFYSDNGWLAGLAKTEPMSANISGNLLTVPAMAITENLVPLTSTTVYQFDGTLVFDAANGQREWSKAGGASTATVKDLSSSNVGNNLAALTNITLNQQASRVGYTWEASGQNIPLAGQGVDFSGQMFSFQGIDDRTNPDTGLQFVPEGFTAKPMLLFDLSGASDGTGKNVWLDPRQSLYHIRPVNLVGSQSFDLATGTSWGRFNQQIDAAVVHPSGYVVGVSTANSKIEILKFGANPVPDAQAPLANIYSGYGTRVGLVHIPVGVAALSSAGFVVLEEADSSLTDAGARIQAFDFFGNPAPIFADNSAVATLKNEGLSVTLLDIAVESKGYIYVLKYLNDGGSVSDYRLDIYNPDGTWLSQTAGLAAARMTVDIWRTMYTLNFALLEKPQGGRSEPSLSIWLPSPPTTQGMSAFSAVSVQAETQKKTKDNAPAFTN